MRGTRRTLPCCPATHRMISLSAVSTGMSASSSMTSTTSVTSFLRETMPRRDAHARAQGRTARPRWTAAEGSCVLQWVAHFVRGISSTSPSSSACFALRFAPGPAGAAAAGLGADAAALASAASSSLSLSLSLLSLSLSLSAFAAARHRAKFQPAKRAGEVPGCPPEPAKAGSRKHNCWSAACMAMRRDGPITTELISFSITDATGPAGGGTKRAQLRKHNIMRSNAGIAARAAVSAWGHARRTICRGRRLSNRRVCCCADCSLVAFAAFARAVAVAVAVIAVTCFLGLGLLVRVNQGLDEREVLVHPGRQPVAHTAQRAQCPVTRAPRSRAPSCRPRS